MVQFDSENPYEVIHWMLAIAEVPPLDRATFVPLAATPLLAASGRAILDLEKTLGDLNESQQPDQVMVVVIIDGQENGSREFTKDRVQKLVDEKQQRGWQFVFLSADMESFNDAASVGIPKNSMLYCASTSQGTSGAWLELTEATNRYRESKGKLFQFRRPGHDDDTSDEEET